MKKNNSGFSLVELIIVIAIMAVLIGVLAPQFIQYVAKSRVSTDLQNIEEMVNACDTYATEHSSYTQAITFTGSTAAISSDVATEFGIAASYTMKGDWSGLGITYTQTSGWTRTGSAAVKGGKYFLDGTFSST